MKRLLYAIFLLSICGHCWADELAFRNLKIGNTFPEFCTDQLDGKQYCSANLNGKISIITFLRLDQQLSYRQAETLQKLYEEFTNKGVVFVGIFSGVTNTAKILSFQQNTGVGFPLLIDNDRHVYSLFGVYALPSSGVFDKNGSLQFFTASNWVSFRKTLTAEIRALLGTVSQAADISRTNEKEQVNRASTSVETRYYLAKVLYDRDELEMAKEVLAQSLTSSPDHIPTLLLAARIAMRERENTAALQYFEKVLQIDPQNTEAQTGRQASREKSVHAE